MASERQIVRTRLAEAQEAVRAPEEFLHEGLARAQGAIDAAAMRHRRATQTALREFPTILANGRPELYDAWGSSRFSVWSEHPALPGEVRVGEVPLGAAALVPATVPLFAGRTVVVVTSTEPAARTARAMIRALAVRASLALGHLGTLHLLDPAQEGFGFTERALLRNTAPLDATPSTSLGAVIDAAYRRRETPDGRVDLVLALDFPLRFDFGAVESLNRITRLSAAGVQLIVHHDLAVEAGNAGHGRHLDLTNPVVIEVRDDGTAHHAWGSLNVTLDSAPPTELVERLTARLPQLPDPQMGTVRFADLNPIEPAEWWRHTATELVSVPVGAGPGGTVSVMFGQEPGGVAHTHAVVGGQPGSGKSELLHTIITGIVTRYGPDDVQLYLVDGQSGVSFQRYRNLPHAVLVSLSTPIDLARGVLLDLDSEFQRRESLLIGMGAQSLTEYRGLGGRGMPRLIVVIDEYQRLFHGDRRDETAGILQRVAAQGRKVGIHLLLASQRFHATGLLNQDALFSNISTRIGMMLPPDALGSVDEFAQEGRGLLGNCAHPGDIVVNHHGGADGHNEVGRVAWLGAAPPTAMLEALATASPHRPELIDGKASPQIGASLALRTLASTPPTPQAIREWAEAGPRDGGLGVNSWQPYDQPWPFILGRTFTAHGSAAAKVDRAAEHNIALLHADAAVLHGMLATGLTAAGLAIPPGGLEVWTLHQLAGPGEPWATALTTDLAATLPGHRVRHSGEAVTLLDEATSELQRRESLTVAAQADIGPLIVVATGLDRVAAFRTVEGRYGEEPSRSTQALLELARRGPFVGVHVLLGFASVPQWSQVMPPKAARHFVHRVVSQLSEDHSRVIVDGSFATRVMPAGTVGPARCGYHNRDTQEAMVFLPYRYDEEARSQLASIAGRRNHGLR